MSDDREDSPDWLRSFQPPVTTLSSDSEPSGHKTPIKYEKNEKEDDSVSDVMQSDAKKSSNKKTTKRQVKVDDGTPAKRRKTKTPKKSGREDHEDVKKEEDSDKPVEASAPNHSILALSSDSESDAKVSTSKEEANEEPSSQKSLELLNKEEKSDDTEIKPKVVVKRKSPKKKVKTEDMKPKEKETNDSIKIEGEGGDANVPVEVIPEKPSEPRVISSTLPLVLPEKVNRSKTLVECEGESIDLSGDMGAVGRVVIADTPSKEPEMYLDLKGTIYKTTIVPSRMFCVVSIGQSEAKIEAIMNDIIQLEPQSNVYDAETMVEGTLEGFSFDSEDEADKTAKDTKDTKGEQTEGNEEKSNAKSKGKAVKKMVPTQKKGKAVGCKQPTKRKPQAPKKGKAKK